MIVINRVVKTPAARAMFALMFVVAGLPGVGACLTYAQTNREVDLPPPDTEPPPAAKAPERRVSSGEDTDPFGQPNSARQRQSMDRRPPPPSTLTVMYKVKYGQTLSYTYPSGKTVEFEQWQSFKEDGYNLMKATNQRLDDGNYYEYATIALGADRSKFDPTDVPMLYMTGDYAFSLSESEVRNLRQYLLDGGTILFNASRGREAFNRAVAREMRRVFPGKRLMPMPPDHPIFNARYRINEVRLMDEGLQQTEKPELYSIDIGTRAAVILIPDGMGAAWSGKTYHPEGRHLMGESAVRLGVNTVAYVLANTTYGRYLAQEFPRYDEQTRPGDLLRFALAQYDGAWNVYPALQNKLMNGIRENTGIAVDYRFNAVPLDSEALHRFPLLIMTGHREFELSSEAIDNLRRYLRNGGTILASAAAGLSPFDRAFRREIKKVLPETELMRLPPTHPMFASGWNPINEVEYTQTALRDDPTLKYPKFFMAQMDGRMVVLYTPYDLFTGVNQEPNEYAEGLEDADALRVAINAITYVMTH